MRRSFRTPKVAASVGIPQLRKTQSERGIVIHARSPQPARTSHLHRFPASRCSKTFANVQHQQSAHSIVRKALPGLGAKQNGEAPSTMLNLRSCQAASTAAASTASAAAFQKVRHVQKLEAFRPALQKTREEEKSGFLTASARGAPFKPAVRQQNEAGGSWSSELGTARRTSRAPSSPCCHSPCLRHRCCPKAGRSQKSSPLAQSASAPRRGCLLPRGA